MDEYAVYVLIVLAIIGVVGLFAIFLPSSGRGRSDTAWFGGSDGGDCGGGGDC